MQGHMKEKQLIDYLEGILDYKEHSLVESHLKECEACTRKVMLLKGLEAASKEVPPSGTIGTNLAPAVKTKIEDIKIKHRRPFSLFIGNNRSLVNNAIGAVAVVLVIILAWSPISKGISWVINNRFSPGGSSSPIASAPSETDKISVPAITPVTASDTKEKYSLGFFRSTMSYKDVLALSGLSDKLNASYDDVPLGGIPIEEEPFLTENDIESFDPQTMVLKLKDGVYQRLSETLVSASPIPFVVEVDGKRLFWGVTIHPISSMYPPENIPRLNWTLDSDQTDAFKLFNIENAPNIDIVLKFLEGTGKDEQKNTGETGIKDIQGNKDNVSEFIELLNSKYPKLTNGFDYESTFNITPKDVSDMGCKVFKSSRTCETLLLNNNNVYPIGIGFGGFGITDIETCDFDNNGQLDLIYTFSWGSGIHRSQIGYFNLSFNLSIRQEVILNIDGKDSFLDTDIMLEKTALDRFTIYSTALGETNGDFINVSQAKGEPLAEIKVVNGEIKANMIQSQGPGPDQNSQGSENPITENSIINLNSPDNAFVALPLPEGWRASKREYTVAGDFKFKSEKNKDVKTLQNLNFFFDKHLPNTIYWESKGSLSGELQVLGYYKDEPNGAVLPNHSSVVNIAFEGTSLLGKTTVYLLDCDIPRDLQTGGQTTFKMFYAVIPIEGEDLAYVLSLAVPLDMEPSEFQPYVKAILGIN